MASERVNITSPVARIVAGSLYKPNTTDFDGKPLTSKTGPNAGQARVNFFFGIAIPKAGENHWAHTFWGRKIWDIGCLDFPQASQRPDFAWKIEDGDSTVPNKRNRSPCDNEGWPGHWILRLSGGFAPKIYRQEGNGFVQVTDENYIKPGFYVEVAFSVDGNGSQNNPGVYLNHSMVCFRGYGAEIVFGPDVNEAGFGQAALPAGATLIPAASSLPLPGGALPNPSNGLPPLPAYAGPQPLPVLPNPQFAQMPPPPGANVAVQQSALPPLHGATNVALPSNLPPPPPPAPPVQAGPQMTALANGASREAFLKGGWTDAQLIAAGYMTI